MHILVKMKMTKHSLWQIPQAAVSFDNLYKTLWKARIVYLGRALTLKKPGPLEGQLVSEVLSTELIILIRRQVAECSGFVVEEEFSSPFQPWQTLKVLVAMLIERNSALLMNIMDRVGVVGVPEEVERIRISAAQSNRMMDKVLNLVSEGLVPFNNMVLDGLCVGNPVQQCNVCMEQVVVKNVVVDYWSNTIPGDPVLVLGQMVSYTLCGRVTCIERHKKDPFKTGMEKLIELGIVLYGEHINECCDFCGNLNHKAKGLRCAGCLTKLYCGVECQVKDTYHLETKCERGEKRKKKRSDATRKEEGVEWVRERLAKIGLGK